MDATALTIIAAGFAPLLVAVLKQTGFPPAYNGAVAIACYVVFGIAAAMISGPLDADHAISSVAVFVTVGTAAYEAFWSNLGVETKVKAATSIIKPPEVPAG